MITNNPEPDDSTVFIVALPRDPDGGRRTESAG